MKLCNCGKLWDDCMGFCNIKLAEEKPVSPEQHSKNMKTLNNLKSIKPKNNTDEIDPLDFYDVDHPCTECEHDPFDCTICTKNDDSKYKRAWEALQERLKGKFQTRMVNRILEIMSEVMEDEHTIK